MTSASAAAPSSPLSGSAQASERASSLPASLAASAAATRRRSASSSSRLPRPTTRTRAGCSGWIRSKLLEGALGVGRARRVGERGGQILALVEPDREQVGVDRGELGLADFDLHRARVYDVAHGGWSRPRYRPSVGQAALIEPRSGTNTQRKAAMPSTVILGTARTPFGKMGGALSSLDATDLGGHAIEAALERSGVDPEQVQQVVFGQVLQAGQGQIPSRQAQIKGGIPKEVPSETINKVCASGMRSVGIADMAIRAGDTEVAVTGGMESMSQAPYLLPGARFGFRMGDVQAIDAMTHDGLTNPFTEKQMINEASEVSNELEITRADMDRFAERSHRLAAEATDAGRLAEEIVGVTVKSRKGENEVEADEAIRARHHARDARQAARDRWRRRHPHRRQRARASTTAPARSSSPPRSGPSRKA